MEDSKLSGNFHYCQAYYQFFFIRNVKMNASCISGTYGF